MKDMVWTHWGDVMVFTVLCGICIYKRCSDYSCQLCNELELQPTADYEFGVRIPFSVFVLNASKTVS